MKRLLVVGGVMVALCTALIGCGHYGYYDHYHGRHYHSDYGRGYGGHYYDGYHSRPHYRHYDRYPCD